MPVYGSQTQYATRTDLANLGLIGGVLASVSTTIQDAALLAASGVADSKLQSRYTLPLSQWGQDLVRAVAIIAAYDVLTSKGYNPAAGADENIRQRYLDALAWLDGVSNGTNTPSWIVDAAGNDSSGEAANAAAPRVHSSEVRGWTDRGGQTVGNGRGIF